MYLNINEFLWILKNFLFFFNFLIILKQKNIKKFENKKKEKKIDKKNFYSFAFSKFTKKTLIIYLKMCLIFFFT